ncbi:unnamed protein product, partial [Owenia fusiformis]
TDLSLCEVKVYGSAIERVIPPTTIKLDLFGSTADSSSGLEEQLPIDADYTQTAGLCTSITGVDPWWVVDLGGSYYVATVNIYTLTTLNNFDIRLISVLDVNPLAS